MSGEDDGWDLQGALQRLRGAIDPYLWEQGQELFRRNPVEDFAVQADGTIQVRVVDPRDARSFFVSVSKEARGVVRARCACPYRLGGHCRHQVVALEYLRAVSEGEAAADAAEEDASAPVAPSEPRSPGGESPIDEIERPVLYHLLAGGLDVSTRDDGSLVRVVLQELGSSRRGHRVALQLWTGTGWTELRSANLERWIRRGRRGPHPRDALLAGCLVRGGELGSEVDSERLATMLQALSGSSALVDRMGNVLPVSPWPWSLGARLVRGEEAGVGVELRVRSGDDAAGQPLDEVTVVPSVRPWIQVDDGAFHPLIAGISGQELEALQEEDLSRIEGDELDRLLAEGIPMLEAVCVGALETEPGWVREVEGVDRARLRLDGHPERLAGELELRYGEEWVPAPSTPEPWTLERDGEIRRYPPAGQSLSRAQRELEGLGFRREDERTWVIDGPQVLARVLAPRPDAFVTLELPSDLGRLDLTQRSPQLRLRIGAAGGPSGPGPDGSPGGDGPGGDRAFGAGPRVDWFRAEFRLHDGERELPVDLQRLREACDSGDEDRLQLEDGTVLGLHHDVVRRLVDLADAPGEDETPSGRELRLRLPAVAELLEERADRSVEFEEGLRELVDALRSGPALPPSCLREDVGRLLRPYQELALRWFDGLGRWGLGGLLADEMGLGKTLMTLAHLFGRDEAEADPGGDGSSPPERGPVLVICPSSLVFNWLDESGRFFPAVRSRGLHGLAPADREAAIAEPVDLLVTSYALLRRDAEALEAREFRAIVLDEGQAIKNAASQTARAAFRLRSDERWILTGTPVENHLGELWSLFHFLMPGFLGERRPFREAFADPIRLGDRDALARLRSRTRPFILRRTKEQVLTDLPPRIEQVERAQPTVFQATLYEQYLAAARRSLDEEPAEGGEGGARLRVLAALTRLRQVCCHPGLVLADGDAGGEAGADGSDLAGGKFALLTELLEECVEEGHRVLLFSQFTSMLDIIERWLSDADIRWSRLDGSTRDRESVIRSFQRDEGISVFLISLKAGGQGLNLTQADTVILYDPWWNPAAEEQAAARAHRLGQTVPVHVHKLITRGTIEEKILDLQTEKRSLAASVVEAGSDPLGGLGVDELRALLD